MAGVDIVNSWPARRDDGNLPEADLAANPAWQYAAARSALYRDGKKVEILGAYEPAFRFMCEWWKQLYGESEGKEHKGLFPASVEFTADLHSMGQYIQEGERHLLETMVRFEKSRHEMKVPFDPPTATASTSWPAGYGLHPTQAMDGTLLAHVEGGVPNIVVRRREDRLHPGGTHLLL